MKKLFSVLLISILICSTLSSCGGGSNALESAAPATSESVKDTLVVASSIDVTSLDPRTANNTLKSVIVRPIFDALWNLEEDMTYTPRLAKSWEQIDDVTLRIYLRDDVIFHNGEKMTSEDVFFTLQRTQEDSLSASTYNFVDFEKMEIIDDYTLDVVFIRPFASAVNTLQMSRAFIVSKKAVEEMGDADFALNPVGSGPFKFKNWDVGVEIELERFDDYWDEPAKTENLTFKIMTEAATRTIGLETGEVDFAINIDAGDINRVNDLDGYHIEQIMATRYTYMTLSMKYPQFDDERIRYALTLAIDKDAIVRAIYGDTAVTATGMYSPKTLGWKENAIPYDLEEAKRLMKEAGVEDGFEITLQCPQKEELPRMAEMVQNMWEKINVKAEIMIMDVPTFTGQGNEFNAAISDANATDPGDVLIIHTPAFGSRMQPNDLTLEAMIHNSEGIYDETERIKALHEIQDYICDIRYFMPISYTNTIYGVTDNLKGFEIRSAAGATDFRTCYIVE